MAYRVDPLVNPVQPTVLNPARDGARAQPSGNELCLGDHAVLPSRHLRHLQIRSGAFFPHTGNKAPGERILPRLAVAKPQPRLLAAVAVAVSVEFVVIFADHDDRAGVVGAVAAATFAVIVRGVGIEASAAVVGVAFARFRFPRFFSFRGFGFPSRLCLFARMFAGSLAPLRLPPFARHNPAQPSAFRRQLRFLPRLLPRFRLSFFGSSA